MQVLILRPIPPPNLKHPSEHALVTGGAGFIGSHLCDALIARGGRVTCVDSLVGTGGSTRNVEHLLGHPRFGLVVEDVLEWAAEADMRGFDCVFHQAASKNSVALEDPERDLTVNALGTLRLLRRAAADGVRRFVHGSTGSVFGEADSRHGEDTPKAPVSPYGISKLAGESYCCVLGTLLDVDYTVLRYYHVVGPRQDSSDSGGVVPIFVHRRLEGRPLMIHGSGAQTRSFTSVHDVVRANLWAAESDQARRRQFNCASGIQVSIQELADFVIAETGGRGIIEYAAPRPGDIAHFAVDNTSLRRAGVAFQTDWRAMVREVIDSQRDAGSPSQTARAAQGRS